MPSQSLAIGPFVQKLIQVDIIKKSNCCPLWGESTGDWWFSSQRTSNVENIPLSWHHHVDGSFPKNEWSSSSSPLLTYWHLDELENYISIRINAGTMPTSLVRRSNLKLWLLWNRLNVVCFNTLRPRQNERHSAEDIFKYIFLNENVWISINSSPPGQNGRQHGRWHFQMHFMESKW